MPFYVYRSNVAMAANGYTQGTHSHGRRVKRSDDAIEFDSIRADNFFFPKKKV